MTRADVDGSPRALARWVVLGAVLVVGIGTPSAVGSYNLTSSEAAMVGSGEDEPPGVVTNAQVAGKPAPAPTEAPAAELDGPGDTLSASVAVLIRLFVLAVILESALAVLFTWRPYVSRFETKTTNPLIMFLAALGLVALFDLDQVGSLIREYGSGSQKPRPLDERWASKVVTALVVAGGSAGVNRMLRALGYRSITAEAEQPKPPRTEAWLAVIDSSAKHPEGTYTILMKSDDRWRVAGTISRPRDRSGPLRWLFRDPRRFPHSGGFAVPLDKPITVGVRGEGMPAPTVVWGPESLSPGAIIDIKVDLSRIPTGPNSSPPVPLAREVQSAEAV